MRSKTLLIIIATFLSLIHYGRHGAFALSDHVIHKYKEDVTGDGLHETIQLNGQLLSNKSKYYRHIWLSIVSPFANEWKIPLKSGYEPSVQFVDLNHNHIYDIFYKNKFSEDSSAYQYDLYSLAHGTIKRLPLPEQQFIRAQYKPNFKINLRLSPYDYDNKQITIDVSKFKSHYIEHSVYDEDGHLLKQAKPHLTKLTSLEPVIISEKKGNGLKSIHEITTYVGQNKLGIIETLWYFENNTWIILQSKWKES